MNDLEWIKEVPTGIKINNFVRYVIIMDKTKTKHTIYALEDKLNELFPKRFFCNWFNNNYINDRDEYKQSYVLYLSARKSGINCDWDTMDCYYHGGGKKRKEGWEEITPEQFLIMVR